MIQSSNYYLKFEENPELFDKLRKPMFLKTELDVVYDDFVRWENSGLLLENEIEYNSQRRYSYVEYTWVKIVEQLRNFGFDYEIIKSFKESLNIGFGDEFYELVLKEKREELLEYYTEEQINKGFTKDDDAQGNSNDPTFFEGFIINVINYNDTVSLLFFHNTPHFCVPVSAEVLKEMEKQPENSKYMEYMKTSHVSISINEIVKKFVVPDVTENGKLQKFTSILSSEEHELLKIIRKHYRGLKEILITTKDNQLHIIEATNIKKAKAESMLIHHFKKGDYKSIKTVAVDGKAVYIEETKKYKL